MNKTYSNSHLIGVFDHIQLYDAHPGTGSAATPLPPLMKRRIDMLEGLRLPKLEVFDCLEEAADIVLQDGRYDMITLEDHGIFIAMLAFPKTRGLHYDGWRLLCYRKV